MKLKHLLAGALMLACACLTSFAADQSRPFLHPLFCNHVVLQRDALVPVWGWTTPGEEVTVQFAGQVRSAHGGADGKWMVKLKPLQVSSQPGTLVVRSASNKVTVQDVLVGDVWLCSGQSNMEMGIGACNIPDEIAKANYPRIRLLTVPKRVATTPEVTLECCWLPCSPATIQQGVWGGFSAAGYAFGRNLHEKLNIPIGLIHSSWGGTVAEAWTSFEALQTMPDMKDRLDNFVAMKESNGNEGFVTRYEKWAQANDPGTAQGWGKPDADLSLWKSVQMPQIWEKAGLPGFDGIAWLRTQFELPADWSGKNLTLKLGYVDDIDTTWVNGVKVGQMTRVNLSRVYQVPASAIKAGLNTISIRVFDTGGDGGLCGKAEDLSIAPADDPSAKAISLAGEWKLRDSIGLAKLPAPPQAPDSNNPNITTVLYNGMIAPIVPFAIKGAIWYQGESNADRAAQYRRLLPTMVKDWQKQFGLQQFPFYIVQLAAFMPTNAEPRDNDWAELREAQALTAKALPHSGLAVALDIGNAKDIHPKNKMEVGRRLALCALADTYGMKIESSGPTFRKMKITEKGIRLYFDHLGGGLTAKDNKIAGFAIAGEDRKFVWADAVFDGDTILVSSPAVFKPVAVRYGWDINPVCNLYNRVGLPAVPFRTDDWPMMTRDRK